MSGRIIECFLLKRISSEVHIGSCTLCSMSGSQFLLLHHDQENKQDLKVNVKRKVNNLLVCLLYVCVCFHFKANKVLEFRFLFYRVALQNFTGHRENTTEVSQSEMCNKISEDANLCKLVFYYEVNVSANDHK